MRAEGVASSLLSVSEYSAFAEFVRQGACSDGSNPALDDASDFNASCCQAVQRIAPIVPRAAMRNDLAESQHRALTRNLGDSSVHNVWEEDAIERRPCSKVEWLGWRMDRRLGAWGPRRPEGWGENGENTTENRVLLAPMAVNEEDAIDRQATESDTAARGDSSP